jgi:hypothetical protein
MSTDAEGDPERQEAVKNDKMKINRPYDGLICTMERAGGQTKAAQIPITEDDLWDYTPWAVTSLL